MALTDRVIIVTGAGSGLGVGVAQALLDDGAKVVLADLRLGPVEQTAAERDGIQPGHLPPEAVSSKEPPAKGPSPADFEEIRAHSAESPAVETVPDRERAHHG